MQGDQIHQIKLKLKGMEVAIELLLKHYGKNDMFYQGYRTAVEQMEEFIEQLETSGV